MKFPRCRILLFAIGCILSANAPALPQSLQLERHGDHLHVTAPQLLFLSGRAAEKLRNGSTVTFLLTLAAAPEHGGRTGFLEQEKFVVSFDLWEEKYSVVQTTPGGKSASRLTPSAAEAWCLEKMPIPVSSVPEREPFMVRLECSIGENEEQESGENHSSLTIAILIDVFSRKKQAEPFRWETSAGPFRLEHLKNVK
jgi:hypothetical protein